MTSAYVPRGIAPWITGHTQYNDPATTRAFNTGIRLGGLPLEPSTSVLVAMIERLEAKIDALAGQVGAMKTMLELAPPPEGAAYREAAAEFAAAAAPPPR